MSEEPDWREVVRDAAEETGIVREESRDNWTVLWPPAYRNKGDLAVRDNVIYNLAGVVSVAVEQAGIDNVTEWDLLGYLFEILVGPEGCCEKVVKHIDKNGWGCSLPVGL